MKKVDEFVEHLVEVFRLFGPLRSRRMFGGYGIFFDDPEVAKIWASRAHEAALRSTSKAAKRPRHPG